MKQRRIVTILAIIAVTGAVSVPNSLAVAWRLDISDRYVVDRGGLEWNPLIHTVANPSHDPEYQTLGHPEHGPIPIPNRPFGQTPFGQTRDTGSSSNESQDASKPSDFLNESPGSLTAPFRETTYGGVPTTPSADPMIEELSHAPR